MYLEKHKDIVLDYIFGIIPSNEMPLIYNNIQKKRHLKEVFETEREKVKIHEYVEGSINKFHKKIIEKRIEEDFKFAKQVRFYKAVHESIELVNLQVMLAEICEDPKVHAMDEKSPRIIHMQDLNKKRGAVFMGMKKWMAAASITLLILLGAGITYQLQTRDSLENRLYSKYYEPINNVNIYFLIKANSLTQAKTEYAKGNYPEALTLLESIPDSLSLSIERQFYLGLTLMEVNAYNEAIQEFNSIIKKDNIKDIKQYVNWYLGLCYLKTGELNSAIEIFEHIVSENEYNYNKAKRILEKYNS